MLHLKFININHLAQCDRNFFKSKNKTLGLKQLLLHIILNRLTTSSRLLSDRQSQLNAVNAVNPEDFLLKRTSSNGQIEEQPIQNYYPGKNDGEIQKPNSNYLKNLVKQSVSIFVRSTCISIYLVYIILPTYLQCRSVVVIM